MRSFKDWVVKELATTTADVAVFARPLGIPKQKMVVVNKSKKNKKRQ